MRPFSNMPNIGSSFLILEEIWCMHSVDCIFVHWFLCIVFYALYYMLCIICIVYKYLCSMHCDIFIVLYTLWNLHWFLGFVFYALSSENQFWYIYFQVKTVRWFMGKVWLCHFSIDIRSPILKVYTLIILKCLYFCTK